MEKNKLREDLRGEYSEIIGNSPQILEVLQQIEKYAATSAKILLLGETGTGKGVVAKALHKNSGRSGEMVSANCSAIQGPLFESQLFGHERGAFTSAHARHIGKFERADKGTLFLDEITEMPLLMQPKLLHAIEENEIERVGGEKSIAVDVRILAATNEDIAHSVENGLFRKDLYHRLNVISISLPTLSERKADIGLLALHFLKHFHPSSHRLALQISSEAQILLEAYPWPGNVRELVNAMEQAAINILSEEGELLLPEHLTAEIWTHQNRLMDIPEKRSTPENEHSVNVPLGTTIEEMTETFIQATLASCNGNRTKTAKVLGINLRTLQRKLKGYKN